MWITITLGSIIFLILLSSSAALIIKKLKKLASENTHFTTLGNEQGKLIMKEENIVGVLSNMKDVFYDDAGELQNGNTPKKYGSLFSEFGIIFFGLTPIKEIYEFSVSWNQIIEKEASEVKNGSSAFEIVKKKEKFDYFKRFYTHAIQIKKVEMTDGSKIDLAFIVTFEVLNIIQVIFKVKPDGIILAQAENAFIGALQDKVREYTYEDFRNNVDKSAPNSPFVLSVLDKTNDIIQNTFHLKATLMEMRYFDLSSGEPGDAEFEAAQKAVKIANINGDAKIAAAMKTKQARKIEGEGNREYFEEIAKVVGKDKIGDYANLEQVKDTQLLSFGQGATSVTPIVNVTPKNKKP